MILLLLQEKQRSLRDLIEGQDLAEYLVSLALAPLTAWAAWKARAPIVQFGFGIMTLMLVASTAIIRVSERGTARFRNIDSSIVEYHRRLLQSYDTRIRFLKSVKFWYAIPLFVGAGLVLRPLFERNLPAPWDIVVLAGLLLIPWLGVRHMNDVRRVGELRRRRDEVQSLLEEMDRE